jgi:D-sedoheptulose 7-phosphate isomerase
VIVRGGVEAPRGVSAVEGLGALRQLDHTRAVLERIDRVALARLCAAVARTHEGGGTVFVCGNGGSATTASHFAQDLAKSTLLGDDDPDRLRVVALTDVSVVTAWANDHGFETVFEQPLRALARGGDLLIALSGSGNSANVLNAVRWANANGVETFAVTGFDGGELRRLAADAVHVDVPDMEIAENAHLAVAHVVVCATREWKRERRGR